MKKEVLSMRVVIIVELNLELEICVGEKVLMLYDLYVPKVLQVFILDTIFH